MVQEIPIYRIGFEEGLLKADNHKDRIFGYCIEANRGPVGEPIYVSSNSEAQRIFGVNFAPHFYQKGSGLILCRVEFPEMVAPNLTYRVYSDAGHTKNIPVMKITSTSKGAAHEHSVKVAPSLTRTDAYNVTVTIDGVGSKKYQNILSFKDIVKKINSNFADYLIAELLVDFDERPLFKMSSSTYFIRNKRTGVYSFKGKTAFDNATSTYNTALETYNTALEAYNAAIAENPNQTTVEEPTAPVASDPCEATHDIILEGPYSNQNLVNNSGKLINGSNGKLRNDSGVVPETDAVEITLDENGKISNTSSATANVDATLKYAYKDAFDKMTEEDIVGLAILSDNEVVQNTLVDYINEMVDPEVYKYRFGILGFKKHDQSDESVSPSDLVSFGQSIDNPFIIAIGQGVKFREEDGTTYDLSPCQAVQLYTGLRSALHYGEAIYGGNSKKVLVGVIDTLPITNDGIKLEKDDIIYINEAGVTTFKKEYKEITFLEGVTTAQDNPVLSHESVMSIVNYVLKRLIRVSKPFQGEPVTDDLKSSLINALNDELKNITDTDKTLKALDDYNIPPYAVTVEATVMAGFNDAGEYIRETHYLVTVKIVPIGTLRSITLSVIVI